MSKLAPKRPKVRVPKIHTPKIHAPKVKRPKAVGLRKANGQFKKR